MVPYSRQHGNYSLPKEGFGRYDTFGPGSIQSPLPFRNARGGNRLNIRHLHLYPVSETRGG